MSSSDLRHDRTDLTPASTGLCSHLLEAFTPLRDSPPGTSLTSLTYPASWPIVLFIAIFTASVIWERDAGCGQALVTPPPAALIAGKAFAAASGPPPVFVA